MSDERLDRRTDGDPPAPGRVVPADPCEHAVFTAGGRLALTAGYDLEVWDVATRARVEVFRAKGESMLGALAACPRSARLAVAGYRSGDVLVIDLDTGVVRLRLPHPQPTHAIAFSADGAWIATGGGRKYGGKPDATVRVWDAETGELRWKLKGLRQPVTSLAFGDGDRLAATAGRTARIWTLDRKRPAAPVKIPRSEPVMAIAFVPGHDDVWLAFGCTVQRLAPEGTVVWDATWSLIQIVACHDLAATPHGVAATVLDEVVLLDAADGSELWRRPGPRRLRSLRASADGATLAAAGRLSSSVMLLDAASGSPASAS